MRGRRLLLVALFAVAGVCIPGGRAVSIAVDYPAITPEGIGAHIAAIQGPRSGTGDEANREKLAEVAAYIRGQLTDDGLVVTEDPVTFGGQTFPNVVGRLEGTTCPEKTFIVGGHYDGASEGPGADDDASGVAGMLEMARVLSTQALPASVDFVGFSFEEAGLIGSRQMAQDAAASSRDLLGMFSMEMIGYTCDEPGCQSYPAGTEPLRELGDFLLLVGNTYSSSLLDTFMESSSAAVPGLIVLPLEVSGNGEEVPDVRRSDHAPFWDSGFKALLVDDTADLRNPNYHQPTDTLDTLDLQFAADVANASAATVVNALSADENGDGWADVCGEAPIGGNAESPQPDNQVLSENEESTSNDTLTFVLIALAGAIALTGVSALYVIRRRSG